MGTVDLKIPKPPVCSVSVPLVRYGKIQIPRRRHYSQHYVGEKSLDGD